METKLATQTKQADVVIVGGGLAGLTAAVYLARAGVGVMVFEKSAELGGRAASKMHEGYVFNRGIHALYTGGAASEVLGNWGLPLLVIVRQVPSLCCAGESCISSLLGSARCCGLTP